MASKRLHQTMSHLPAAAGNRAFAGAGLAIRATITHKPRGS
jgi:hypothetical protein